MNLFQTPEYLNIFAKHFCKPENIVDGIWEQYQGKLVLLGMKPVLGNEEVTDFGFTNIAALPAGFKNIQLDYIREDSQTYSRYGSQGVKQEVSPYIDLPKNWDEYLVNLERKNRKELKRKFKRLDEVKHEFVSGGDFDEFIRLHRLSDPNKNKFMSDKMVSFFKDVFSAEFPGWQTTLDFLMLDGQAAAAIISFSSNDEIWLYNSGYDPQFSHYSVGLMVKAYKIRQAIESGKKKFDFLRGAERYKYDLGAKDLNLYRIGINKK